MVIVPINTETWPGEARLRLRKICEATSRPDCGLMRPEIVIRDWAPRRESLCKHMAYQSKERSMLCLVDTRGGEGNFESELCELEVEGGELQEKKLVDPIRMGFACRKRGSST